MFAQEQHLTHPYVGIVLHNCARLDIGVEALTNPVFQSMVEGAFVVREGSMDDFDITGWEVQDRLAVHCAGFGSSETNGLEQGLNTLHSCTVLPLLLHRIRNFVPELVPITVRSDSEKADKRVKLIDTVLDRCTYEHQHTHAKMCEKQVGCASL